MNFTKSKSAKVALALSVVVGLVACGEMESYEPEMEKVVREKTQNNLTDLVLDHILLKPSTLVSEVEKPEDLDQEAFVKSFNGFAQGKLVAISIGQAGIQMPVPSEQEALIDHPDTLPGEEAPDAQQSAKDEPEVEEITPDGEENSDLVIQVNMGLKGLTQLMGSGNSVSLKVTKDKSLLPLEAGVRNQYDLLREDTLDQEQLPDQNEVEYINNVLAGAKVSAVCRMVDCAEILVVVQLDTSEEGDLKDSRAAILFERNTEGIYKIKDSTVANITSVEALIESLENGEEAIEPDQEDEAREEGDEEIQQPMPGVDEIPVDDPLADVPMNGADEVNQLPEEQLPLEQDSQEQDMLIPLLNQQDPDQVEAEGDAIEGALNAINEGANQEEGDDEIVEEDQADEEDDDQSDVEEEEPADDAANG